MMRRVLRWVCWVFGLEGVMDEVGRLLLMVWRVGWLWIVWFFFLFGMVGELVLLFWVVMVLLLLLWCVLFGWGFVFLIFKVLWELGCCCGVDDKVVVGFEVVMFEIVFLWFWRVFLVFECWCNRIGFWDMRGIYMEFEEWMFEFVGVVFRN